VSAVTAGQSRVRAALARLRSGPGSIVLYGLLAALSFPTFELLRWRTAAPVYAHDVFDADGAVPRIGATLTQVAASGPSLWDPRILGGLPAIAHGALTPIAPDVAIGLIAGPFIAFVVTGWLLAFLAGIGMHRFLRDSVGLPTVACLLGSIVFLFSFWHYVYGFAGVIAPLVMWAGDRFVAGERRSAPLLIGVAAVVLGVYAGLAQIALLVGGLHLVWVLVGSKAGTRRARVGAWLAIWGLGLALYLPVLVTQVGLLPISVRTIWDIPYLYETRLIPALVDRLQFYSAVFLGIPIGPNLGQSPAYYGTYFTGAIGLFLLGTMVLLGRRRPAARFAILLLVAIPIADWLTILVLPHLEALGSLQSFQFVRIRHLLPFALALGVAIGAGRLMGLIRLLDTRAEREARRARATLAALGVAVLGLVGLQAAIAIGRLGSPGTRWPVAGRELLAVALVLGLATLAVALVVALLGRRRPGARLAPVLVVGLLLLAAGERVAYAHGERLAGGQIGTWAANMSLTSAQAAIWRLGGADPGRTLSFDDEPNRMSFHGLDQVDGYVALYPVRYHDLFRVLIARCLDADPPMRAYYDGWGQRLSTFCPDLDPEVLDLLGVRWISAARTTPAVPGLVVRSDAGGRTLYENPGAFNRVFLAGGATVVPDTSAAQAALGAASRDTLAGEVVVTAADASGPLPASPGIAGPARVARSDPGEVVVDIRPDRPAILVLTDVVYPDWSAEIDGRPAAIVPVDIAFRGVVVGPGDQRVIFRYRPVGTWVGFGLAAIALVVTALAALGLWRRERRATAGRPPATGLDR
jgi:hypothetical protein